MTKRTDPEKAWAAYATGHRAVREWLQQIPHDAWPQSSVLPGWTVTELAAHIALVADSVAALPVAARGVTEKSLSDYITAYAPVADVIADATLEIAAAAGQERDGVLAAIDERFSAATVRMEELGGKDQVMQARRGPIRLSEFLLSRVIEIVVHADDLARSVPDADALAIPRDPERTAVRALLDVLASRAPGRTVEVRVPPHAAVQCIEGPRHTRGTPPNVIEMAPTTWIRIATGRSTWSAEMADGRVSASGERADLAAHLPLM